MSVRVMTLVFEAPLPKPEKFLLLALADHANDAGASIFPGNARLARFTSDSERNVRRTLTNLEEWQLIAALDGRRGGRARGTEWIINLRLLEDVVNAGAAGPNSYAAILAEFRDRKAGHLEPIRGHHGTERRTPPATEPSEPSNSAPTIPERHAGETWGAYLQRISTTTTEEAM